MKLESRPITFGKGKTLNKREIAGFFFFFTFLLLTVRNVLLVSLIRYLSSTFNVSLY